MKNTPSINLAFIGFGEAAAAFVQGWAEARPALLARITAYDNKTSHANGAVRAAKLADYQRWQVNGCNTLAGALAGAHAVFSVVTADQAKIAAAQAAADIKPGTLFFDCNSCAPGTKRQAADIIEAAGGRYVDVAVMAAVHPALHKVPLLISTPHATALEILGQLDMVATEADRQVGNASSVKMVRSLMIKGLESLVAECVLAGRRAGVDEAVLDSLDVSFPGFKWKERSAYMLDRVMTHGIRRAAEMREVALTVEELGLNGAMTHAAIEWQQLIGELQLKATDGDYRQRADAILQALPPTTDN